MQWIPGTINSMQAAATLTWLLIAVASGTSSTGEARRPGLPGCEPWPACVLEAGGVAVTASDERPPSIVRLRDPDERPPSVVRLRDPGERFPVVRLTAIRPSLVVPDSVQGLFEYSDGYSTRLDIHRVASYATLPLFLAQVVIGEVLLRNVGDQPAWAKYAHGPLAGALGGLFVVNTVTGGLNLLEARRDPNVESRTLIHSMIMILADAGFVWTGLTVRKAGTVAPNGRVRTAHRRVALIAMGVATTGYLIMIPPFRRD
jgi:hypothetical protein